MTGDDLGRFIAELRAADVLTGGGFQYLHIKFGDAIDQDENDASWSEEIAPRISVMREIEWDLEINKPAGLAEMIAAVTSDSRRIYRGMVSLGTATNAVLEPITRTGSPENKIDFNPYDLSVEIGPVEIHTLESDKALVGWIGVSFHGYGYLYPWTLRDVVDRIDRSPEIQRMMQVCRSFWPVPERALDPRIVELRKEVKPLWPYDRYDKPWDWYWGVRETG
jgi:hypothetical protein